MKIKMKLALIRSIGVGTLILNVFFWAFRKNKPSFPIHFSSTYIKPQNIKFKRDLVTLKSMAVSSSCYFQANNGIILGSRCLFAPGVKIISSNHDLNDINRKSMPAKSIIIGNDVWIGASSIILPEVEIADRVVIGAGSVVTKSILEKGAIVAGNPATILQKE